MKVLTGLETLPEFAVFVIYRNFEQPFGAFDLFCKPIDSQHRFSGVWTQI